MKVDILGTEYTIHELSKEEDSYLSRCDGYCDKISKKIVITTKHEDNELDDWEVYRKKVLRHEIIHAFLYESGLHENFKHNEWGHDETFVDWVACQYDKMLAVFQKVGCI